MIPAKVNRVERGAPVVRIPPLNPAVVAAVGERPRAWKLIHRSNSFSTSTRSPRSCLEHVLERALQVWGDPRRALPSDRNRGEPAAFILSLSSRSHLGVDQWSPAPTGRSEQHRKGRFSSKTELMRTSISRPEAQVPFGGLECSVLLCC